MDFNLISNLESCYLAVKDNPPLLYYSHIPSAIVALFLGAFVFYKNKTGLINKILLGLAVVFSLWSFLNLVVWTSYDSKSIMFAWSLLGILFSLLFLLALYFVYVFIHKKDAPLLGKIFGLILFLPVILLTPTSKNLTGFDVANCEAGEGIFFTDYYYLFGLFIFFWILFLVFLNYRKAGLDREEKRQIILLATGIELFLLSFFSTGYIASKIDSFWLEQYGLFGMVIFMGFLAYLIVKFKAFEIKLLGAQALVVSLIILIGSQFAFIRNNTNKILTAITLVLAAGFGWMLIRSVKKENEQKEALELANIALKKADQAKNEFINIASHQLRTPVTVIKGTIAMLIDGSIDSFDDVTKKRLYEGARFKCKKLEDIINDILSATSLTNKKFSVMDRDAEKINIKEFFTKMIEEFTPETMEREIELTLGKLDATVPEIVGQKQYLEEAFSNLITNAIKYTPSPKQTPDIRDMREGRALIEISSRKVGNDLIFSIKDNGIGISTEEIPKLFHKFVRAENAKNMYTDGTGLGLFIVREVIEGHGGKVWVESELGKGAEFFVQLPIKPATKVDVKEYIQERADLEM